MKARRILPFLMLPAMLLAAEVEVTLRDGRVMEGRSLEYQRGHYHLGVEDGQVVVVPAALVRQIRFTGGSVAPPGASSAPAEPKQADSEDVATVPTRASPAEDAASGPVTTVPAVTVPEPPRAARAPGRLTPSPEEQLAAFGREPARFRRGAVDTTWRYEDVLGRRTDVTQFNPARWYRARYDPTWTPTDGFKTWSLTPPARESSWYRPRYDPTWTPHNGFGRTDWFQPILSLRE